MVGILNPIIAARIYTALDTTFSVEESEPSSPLFHRAAFFTSRSIPHPGESSAFRTSRRSPTLRTPSITSASSAPTSTRTPPPGHRARNCSPRRSRRARRKGYEKFFTYVRADNEPALQTYLRQGFRIVGTAERHAKIDGRYVDEIVIEKLLQPTGD